MKRLWRRLRCRLSWCSGYVVSGTHDGVVWVGWRCHTCGVVKHYAPAAPAVMKRAQEAQER